VCVEAIETVGAGVASGPAEDEPGVADGAEMTMIAIGTPIWTGCGLVMVPTVLPYVEHPVSVGIFFKSDSNLMCQLLKHTFKIVIAL
jgi:hypothetical protein